MTAWAPCVLNAVRDRCLFAFPSSFLTAQSSPRSRLSNATSRSPAGDSAYVDGFHKSGPAGQNWLFDPPRRFTRRRELEHF
jgi:hypothetical protein